LGIGPHSSFSIIRRRSSDPGELHQALYRALRLDQLWGLPSRRPPGETPSQTLDPPVMLTLSVRIIQFQGLDAVTTKHDATEYLRELCIIVESVSGLPLDCSPPGRIQPPSAGRCVATAGNTGDASLVRPTMSPCIKVTTDSLSSELTFDE